MFSGFKALHFWDIKLSSTRISPDPQKVKAISEMPKPLSKTDLHFIGMVAYLLKFIPNLSDKTKKLCELILKETVWDFTEIQKSKFDKLKSTIANWASIGHHIYPLCSSPPPCIRQNTKENKT